MTKYTCGIQKTTPSHNPEFTPPPPRHFSTPPPGEKHVTKEQDPPPLAKAQREGNPTVHVPMSICVRACVCVCVCVCVGAHVPRHVPNLCVCVMETPPPPTLVSITCQTM